MNQYKKVILLVSILLCVCITGCMKQQAILPEESAEMKQQATLPKESATVEISPVYEQTPSPTEPEEPRQKETASEETMPEKTPADAEEKVLQTELACPSVSGALGLAGTRLIDQEGNPVQLRGISTHGLAWFPQYVNQDCFYQLKTEWNVNVMRLAMYVAEEGGYCTGGDKEALKKLVKEGVSYAEAADMYVIIDWHVLREANPNTYKEDAKQFFDEMSKEFAEKNHVLYEICNEPNGGVSWAEVKAYAEEIIPVIRANDADAIIIVGTPTWSQDVDLAAADPIEGYDNIMYALHFYAATHTEQLRQKMVAAIEAGLPIFVTEFGTCDASGNGNMDYGQSNDWITRMDEYGVSYVAWNLSNKAETSAILKTECEKLSGFAKEDLTNHGIWLQEKLTGTHWQPTAPKAVEREETKETAGAENGIKEETQAKSEEAEEKKKGIQDNLAYTAEVSNSWEADGKTFYQYNILLKNESTQEKDGWLVALEFSEDIALSDGWNGDYSVEGTTLIIAAKDYNRKIAPQGEVRDIGFIISGGSNLELCP